MKMNLTCPWCKAKIIYDSDVDDPDIFSCCEQHKKSVKDFRQQFIDRLDILEGRINSRWEILDIR